MNPKTFLLALVLLAAGAPDGRAQSAFDASFEKKALRIDFALNGNASGQTAALKALREEPLWAGPVHRLIDPFDYGGYFVYVRDQATGRLLYSRGFNTLFEEWRTTEQARTQTQSWANSISVPFPRRTVTVEIAGRNRDDMRFHPLLTFDVDPASIFIDRGRLARHPVTVLQRAGDTADKVDLVFLAEGYTAGRQKKFLADARRFTEALFATPPFDTRRSDFNVRAVGLVSEEAGTDVAGEGVFRHTALNSGYYTFGLDRYLTTPDMKAVRDAVWDVPCDAIVILVDAATYGGGGMYNFYAIATADNDRTASVFVHEFGHSFAGLADEYYESDVAYDDHFYNLDTEPWEPNITTLVAFNGKWADLVDAATPVPTPLEEEYTGRTGVFEGGGYRAKGIYRPQDHCMMRDYAPFCPVCTRAIRRMIDYLSDRE
jgi:hypothetical protein